MNSGKFAALAVTASLLAFAMPPAGAADGPLSHFAGTWSGSGKITVQNGSSERIRCRSSNSASGNGLALTLRCASDSYKFELASDITSSANAVGFNATLQIHATGNGLSVLIRSPGSEISEVAISMAKGGR